MEDLTSSVRWRVSEFGALISVSASTLRRWDRSGVLVPHRYVSGTRYYTMEHLEKALGLSVDVDSSSEYRSFLSQKIQELWKSGTPRGELLRKAQEAWASHRSNRQQGSK
jgi:hypothetical protein